MIDASEKARNHSSHRAFYDYYARESESPAALGRFVGIRQSVLRLLPEEKASARPLEVADIGCGAGTQALLWAGAGDRVHAIDINEPLLQLARNRAAEQGVAVDFHLGTAEALPWPDVSMDVCLVPELLEHVPAWEPCLNEFSRILRPHGVLFLSTTNRLCPRQEEFELPLYSWYPAPLKRKFEEMARTTRPEIAGYATYPAVHWFTYYELRDALLARGFATCLDRFDAADVNQLGRMQRLALGLLLKVPPLHWLGHVFTPYTRVLAIKGA